MSAPRTIVAAHIVLYINGSMLGRVTGIQFNSGTPIKEARGIDSPFVQELMPTMVSVSGSMRVIRLHADGGLQQAGVIPQLADIAKGKYFSILLIDRATDLPVFQSDSNMCSGESWSVDAKGVLSGSFNFQGISWSNESANAKPQSL